MRASASAGRRGMCGYSGTGRKGWNGCGNETGAAASQPDADFTMNRSLSSITPLAFHGMLTFYMPCGSLRCVRVMLPVYFVGHAPRSVPCAMLPPRLRSLFPESYRPSSGRFRSNQ